MNNVVYNKPTIATSQILPYTSERAVDGDTRPVRRWLANPPCSMTINLMDRVWVDRWIVINMGNYWHGGPDYNNRSYSLKGSIDNYNWFELDRVDGNQSNMTNRTFEAKEVIFLMLSVDFGLNINPQLASVSELAVYEASPTSPYLESLIPSVGILEPSFNSQQFYYSINVAHSVSNIAFTPISIQGGRIEVNSQVVESGQLSQSIALVEGLNQINIETTSKVGGLKSNYEIEVVRAKGFNLYLSEVKLDYFGRGFTSSETIDINHDSQIYQSITSSKASLVKVTPIAEDSSVLITVNGESVLSGSTSSGIKLPTQSTDLTIIVSKSGTSETKTYTITIERGSTKNK